MESILNDVKKCMGIGEKYTAFDVDLIIFINATLATLVSMGIGPDTGMAISSADDTWEDVFQDTMEHPQMNMVKAYVYIRTRQLFDTPQVGAVNEALKAKADEYEFRLYSLFNFGEGVDV